MSASCLEWAVRPRSWGYGLSKGLQKLEILLKILITVVVVRVQLPSKSMQVSIVFECFPLFKTISKGTLARKKSLWKQW